MDRAIYEVEPVLRPFIATFDARSLDHEIDRWRIGGLTVRRLRGSKMRTLDGLYDEVSAALQFPGYFGRNLDALNDCMADLSWLPSDRGYLLVVERASEVLAEDSLRARESWIGILATAASIWNAPVTEGQWWDRPPIPFHVLLVDSPDRIESLSRSWHAAGIHTRGEPWV